jgi:hypothetical protein
VSAWARAAASDRDSWAVPVSVAGWGTSGRESGSADPPQPLEPRLQGRGLRPGGRSIGPSFRAPYVCSRSRRLTDSVPALR